MSGATTSAGRLLTVGLPPLSELEPEPRLPASVFESRVAAARAAMSQAGLDALAIYADREHSANTSWLVGFDPRFEEALVVLLPTGDPVVITGNESLALLDGLPISVTGVLCQSLSLPDQDRSVRARLSDAIAEAGVGRGLKVGVVGWKPIPEGDAPSRPYAIAAPQFVLAGIEEHLGARVVDATALVAGIEGTRAFSEADQLAVNEHRATRASGFVWRALDALAPGRTEREVARAMGLAGEELSAHVMCTSGPSSVVGLLSPTDRVIEYGDRLSTAVGLWGGLCSRAGRVASADDPEVEAAVSRQIGPYAQAQRAWYESLRIGAPTGPIVDRVVATLASAGMRPLLNPGHLVHLDEWYGSPFVSGRTTPLWSGMALQCDIIPVGPEASDVLNAEDTLALADEALRAELSERFPAMWARVQARRGFMQETLGIELADEVLPFSDRQGAIPAGLLDPATIVVAPAAA